MNRIRRNHWHAALWLVIFLGRIYLCNALASAATPQIITVFIHGTVAAPTAIWYGLPFILNDNFPGNSGCEIRMHKKRTKSKLQEEELVLDLGLHKIEGPSPSTHKEQHAAYHIVRAFSACAESTTLSLSNPPERHYYTFGWSGILSEQERKRSAQQLRTDLLKVYQSLRAQHEDVQIELYAHSHGCQIVLYLAQANRETAAETLFVNRAILSGAPLYYNAVSHLFMGTFKTIFNIYSLGDLVQTLDIFSIPNKACKRRFSDLYMPFPATHTHNVEIVDILVEAEYCPYFFGHSSFFTLNRYSLLRGHNREYHEAYRAVLNELHPLPLVVLYPLIIANLNPRPGIQHICANVGLCHNKLAIAVHATERLQDTKIIYVPETFCQLRDVTRHYYGRVYNQPIRQPSKKPITAATVVAG